MAIQRVICDKGLENVKVAQLPFIIVTEDGIVGEADSVRGLISIIIPEYMDAEDDIDDWNLRVQYARRQAMFAIQNNITIDVYDKIKGKINNNYAAAADDDDYSEEDDIDNKKIYVDDEKSFLFSLKNIGNIKLLQRTDVDLLLTTASCDKCAHNTNGICSVYKSKIDNLKEKCESGILNIDAKANAEYFIL